MFKLLHIHNGKKLKYGKKNYWKIIFKTITRPGSKAKAILFRSCISTWRVPTYYKDFCKVPINNCYQRPISDPERIFPTKMNYFLFRFLLETCLSNVDQGFRKPRILFVISNVYWNWFLNICLRVFLDQVSFFIQAAKEQLKYLKALKSTSCKENRR